MNNLDEMSKLSPIFLIFSAVMVFGIGKATDLRQKSIEKKNRRNVLISFIIADIEKIIYENLSSYLKIFNINIDVDYSYNDENKIRSIKDVIHGYCIEYAIDKDIVTIILSIDGWIEELNTILKNYKKSSDKLEQKRNVFKVFLAISFKILIFDSVIKNKMINIHENKRIEYIMSVNEKMGNKSIFDLNEEEIDEFWRILNNNNFLIDYLH